MCLGVHIVSICLIIGSVLLLIISFCLLIGVGIAVAVYDGTNCFEGIYVHVNFFPLKVSRKLILYCSFLTFTVH